jgi:nicotinamidase-related amidase
MSDRKYAYRSFYYQSAELPEDIKLDPQHTALLVIDIQNSYLEVDTDPLEAERWAPFREHMNSKVIPNTGKMFANSSNELISYVATVIRRQYQSCRIK